MTKTQRAPAQSPSSRSAASQPIPVISSAPPLKPRRRLLLILSIVFALWIAALLALYFKSVYPQRHPSAGSGQTQTY